MSTLAVVLPAMLAEAESGGAVRCSAWLGLIFGVSLFPMILCLVAKN